MDFKSLLLSPKGRIPRKTYWLGALALVLVSAVLQFAGFAALQPSMGDDGILHMSFGTLGSIVLLVVSVAMLVITWANLMLVIKRCHDRGRTGWFFFVALIPLVGPLWLLVELGFMRGTIGPNRFGGDPTEGAPQLGYAV